MLEYLNDFQKEKYLQFKEFAKTNVEPFANDWDRNEKLSKEILTICAKSGLLKGFLPTEYGGEDWDTLTYGLLNEAVGQKSVSLTGLFNVHYMVLHSILKWGSDVQKVEYIPLLASGERIGAFALTEPEAGSDIQNIQTTFEEKEDCFVVNGIKRWITFGGIADIFLVFGKLDKKPVACLIEKGTDGFAIEEINNMLGFRAAHLARLSFVNCKVPKENLIGMVGTGTSIIAPYALSFGRVSVAFASLGILKSCLELTARHSNERQTFNSKLCDHGIIREMITEMGTDYEACKAICVRACNMLNNSTPKAMEHVMMAKYFTSKTAAKHASNAVQIMGAIGCHENNVAARLYRDAKIMEVVEGSNQVLALFLGKYFSVRERTL